jgi:hypothetical protein
MLALQRLLMHICIPILSQQNKNIPRDGAVVARWAHNPKVAGSSPAPATQNSRTLVRLFVFKLKYPKEIAFNLSYNMLYIKHIINTTLN